MVSLRHYPHNLLKMQANNNDNDDNGRRLIEPPTGYGFRRQRRRTSYYRRSVMSYNVRDNRRTSELHQMAMLWICHGMQHLGMALIYILQMMEVTEHDDTADHLFDDLHNNAIIAYAVANDCIRIAAKLSIDSRSLLMFPINSIYEETILSTRNKRNRCINELNDTTAYFFTGFTVNQLHKMYLHLRIPQYFFPVNRRCRYTGEETLVTFLYWLRKGSSFIEMSSLVFGGDARDFSHMMRLIVHHLYVTFYHKISGDSLRMWTDYIDDFRLAIYNRLTSNPRWWEMAVFPDMHAIMDLSYECFRIFGFLDDVEMATSRPGDTTNRRMFFLHDVQRAFYSGYFKSHGLKAQAVLLPNGMYGSVFLSSMAHNDIGTLNLSGIDDYLQTLLVNQLIDGHFPSLYVDAIFNVKNTIIPRFKGGHLTQAQDMFNKRMAGVRVCVEHAFGLHSNLFGVLHQKRLLKIFNNGKHIHNLFMVTFLIQNCYQTFNHSLSMFDLHPPSIEVYLPVDEVLTPAPFISDNDLGTVFNFELN